MKKRNGNKAGKKEIISDDFFSLFLRLIQNRSTVRCAKRNALKNRNKKYRLLRRLH